MARMELGCDSIFRSSTFNQLKYFEAKLVIILSPLLKYTMRHEKKKKRVGEQVKMKRNTLKYMLLIK